MRILVLVILMAISAPTLATWQLDNLKSKLNFVSIKKATIAENNSFKQLKGAIDQQNKLTIGIDLTSVNTNVLVRDERLKTLLFNTDTFTQANFSAQLPANRLKTLKVGESKIITVQGKLDFHGQQQALTLEVSAVKLSEQQLFVTTSQPFFINAADFALVQGINELKALAGLPSIDHVVPITFIAHFNLRK